MGLIKTAVQGAILSDGTFMEGLKGITAKTRAAAAAKAEAASKSVANLVPDATRAARAMQHKAEGSAMEAGHALNRATGELASKGKELLKHKAISKGLLAGAGVLAGAKLMSHFAKKEK